MTKSNQRRYTEQMNSTDNNHKTVPIPASLLELAHFQAELEATAETLGKTREQALKHAQKCLREIAATPSESWLAPAAKMARFIYTRSYEPELDINLEALEELRELSKDNLLLFLWSHKSHMDSFVFLLSLYENAFKPIPLVFAGINMNFLGFGTLARKVGAIFLRRSFQDDPIYKLVFRHYIDYLIRNRLPLTWSIEGTRSRTGKLSPPKLGILNWVLEACEREDMHDVKLVPVSIAFDRIAEIDDYVALQRGLPKRKESLRWFLNFIFGMKEPYGKIYVRYAEPVSLESVAATSQTETGESTSQATRLAFEVCTRIEQITPIKSADVLTMVLLGANGRALSLAEIFEQAKGIALVARERNLPVARGFSLADEEEIAAAILSMRGSSLVKAYDKGTTPVFYIPEEQQLAAAYYRNTITHYFLAAALGEIALAQSISDINVPSEESLRQRVEALRELFKFEFFFRPKDEFWQEVLQEVNRQYPHWHDSGSSLSRQLTGNPPRFGHAILRSIAEAYKVTASTLATLGYPVENNDKKFIGKLLDQGGEMLLRRQISGVSTLSRDLFSTSLRLAEHRQLLGDPDEDIGQRRQNFKKETESLVKAIDMLQDCYNSAWFDSTDAE
ncbi:MAG: 1-acyl-sn-glycerol-3-phosphate acyltransferase [Halioglobus sp.]